MDYILLVAIIVMLLHHKITIKSKIYNLNRDINGLNERLEQLLKLSKTNTDIGIADDKNVLDQTIVPDSAREKNPVPDRKEKPTIQESETKASMTKMSDITQPFETNKKSIDVSLTHVTAKALPVTKSPKTRKPPKPTLWERFKEKNPDLEKFIGENLINKLGMLILVLGISYFVRFAIDKNWINEPARVGIGILVGSLVMVIAHKLRKRYAAFSSVIVAGAIAIFYFTTAIAFHEYELFSQTVAFAIMVLITAFSCLISLSYNRIELAILSLIGGFAVPFMISTGSGNYVVLFIYIIILDIGILALAYFKKWTLVTTLAFVFTFLLLGGWVSKELTEEALHYAGALIFAFIFYSIFVLTNIINNLRTKGIFSKSQLIILGLNTFVFYGIGMFILADYHPEFSGGFTAFLAILNLIFAWFLYKKFGLDKTAVYVLIGMTLTFITLAIPIQFQGNYITLFWAGEAVLLMWLAQKSQIKGYRFGAVLVQILMLISLFADWFKFYGDTTVTWNIVTNPIFVTGIVAIGSLVGVCFLLNKENEVLTKYVFNFNPKTYRKLTAIVAIILGYFVGIFEVIYQTDIHLGSEDHILFSLPLLFHLIYTAVLCFFLYQKKKSIYDRLLVFLSFLNSIGFSFGFMQLPFFEMQESIRSGSNAYVVFYLHYVAFVLVIYFFYLIYKTNKRQAVFPAISPRLVVWVVAFLMVFIASTEVLLHGFQIMDLQITAEELAKRSTEEGYTISDTTYVRDILASEYLETAKMKIMKTGWPVTWGILAFVFLIIGIQKSLKDLRIFALSLLGITIVKLFVYDISNVSETGKIIAFILLGVLILVISFVYQKLKRLVIDQDKTIQEDA